MAVDRLPCSSDDAGRRRRVGTALMVSAAFYIVGLATVGLVFVSSPPPTLVGHVEEFEQGLTTYRWGFVGASLLAPLIVAVLTLLMTAARVPIDSTRRWIGSILVAAYVPLATVVYTSQYTFLPALVERDVHAAALWYMHDSDSIPYALDLAGYALLGVGAIVSGTTVIHAGRRFRWIAAWLTAMGALSLAALALHAAGSTTLAAVATASSAACTVPVMLLAFAAGRRLRRQGPPRITRGAEGPPPVRTGRQG
jgi:hypothetical protein